MKVLFAVSNEEISEAIVKKYQKEYKQIISYKNVYYFNAILKELQKDKSYDRVVISEDLEAFTHTQYDQIDKFIFEKLDSISDEASNSRGNDIPIILICSDRRTKSEQMLVKLFGIGIYNAVLGQDRSVDEVCKIINRPRAKKEAKNYYKIESESVNYKSETENDVTEVEIQNILAHYKRLGKNEEKYIESFDNIAAQYNDTQLRIISKFLPLNVRAVLEESSPKYQQIMSFNSKVSDKIRMRKKDENGTSEKLLKSNVKEKIISKPVVIPSSINMNSNQKLAKIKRPIQQEEEKRIEHITEEKEDVDIGINDDNQTIDEIIQNIENTNSNLVKKDDVKPVKRGRGRPRKNPVEEKAVNQVKRGRGRPRKNPEQKIEEENILPELFETTDNDLIEEDKDIILPGLNLDKPNNEENQVLDQSETDNEKSEYILPGLSENYNSDDTGELFTETQNNNYINNNESEIELPDSSIEDDFSDIKETNNINERNQYNNDLNQSYYGQTYNPIPKENNNISEIETIDLTYLLTPGKKIASFVGTSKNGTSFIINNLAQLLSNTGINVAILDTTKNRNSYYIYTKNEEELRNIASYSIDNLVNGIANGIKVNNNLTVYTSLPTEGEAIVNVDKILETLLKQHSLILIDTDFDTPYNYFKQSQEIYLVQSLDILTIQPLTAFLRELKAKNILEEKKLRVILNKNIRIRGINDKTIIGGMAYYNDPSMSFMTELFDRTLMKYISLPFEEETYIKYLEGIIECNISLKGYSKAFMQSLKSLANMVYPSTNTYRPPMSSNNASNNTFSTNINNTLDRMKNSY